jgi:hypothetical protein
MPRGLQRFGIEVDVFDAVCLEREDSVLMGLFDRIRRKSAADTNPRPEAGEDALRLAELVPQGGAWRGLLFDNPNIGLPPALTWTFEFQFGELSRDYGDSPVSFTADWVPLPGAAWSAMAGHSAASEVFAEPIECSAYFFAHHRYDAVQVRVLEQRGSKLRVAVKAHGDVDGLGIPKWTVDEWLDFDGIYVQLSDTNTVEEATARLATHSDISGLVGSTSSHNFKFLAPRS